MSCDYSSVATVNKVQNKFKKASFHATKSEFVNAPIINELPLALDCKLIKYDDETGLLFGEIINVSADDNILKATGNVDVEKYMPIVIDPMNNVYLQLEKKSVMRLTTGVL